VVLSLPAVWVPYLPAEERFHWVLAAMVAAIGCIAIITGYQRQRRLPVFGLLAGGLGLIFAGAYLGNRLPSHAAEMAVTMTGSSLMIAAHLINHTFCENCDRCNRG
jgi:MerC mercury resistance protein